MSDQIEKQKTDTSGVTFKEFGVAGAKIYNGYVYEEFLKKLQLERGQKVYREMRDNNAIINSIMFAIEMTIRGVEWNVIPADESSQAEDAADFLEGVLFDDMSHTFDDFISEVLTMLTFGWQYTEIVYKRRLGPNHIDPSKRSIYDDGYIGIRKLANRAQETLHNWKMDDDGGVDAMRQQPPQGGQVREIPIEKSLLFRPHPWKNSPEGRSPLRGAYVSYFYLKRLQEQEAIGIERNLNGFPVISIPEEILNSPEPADKATVQKYVEMARDAKHNAQGGAVISSATYTDSEGNPTNNRKVIFELLSTNVASNIDTNNIIERYQRDIARTVLADFVMLGSNKNGSYALSRDKTDLFVRSISGWLESIATTLNRYLVSRLWRINGFDQKYQPYLEPGRIAPPDLESLGRYVKDLTGSGIFLSDEETEENLRAAADLPEKPDDAEDNIMPSSVASDAVALQTEGEMDEA